MATAIQRRRGNATQHASFTGLAGEITIDTTNNTVIVHDGSTAGGHRLAKYIEVQAASEGDITAVTAGNGLTGGAASGAATLNIDPSYFDKTAGGTGFQANFEPQANNTYSLGSLTNVWKDVYVGPGSLYVNGTKVLEEASGTIQFTADTNQNISILTTGTGDLELTAGGDIQLKSNVVLSAGKVITTAGGGATKFTSNINMNSNNINNVADPVAAQDAATKAYVDGTSYLTGGDGVTNTAGTIAVDSTVVRTSGAQTIAGNKTFSNDVTVSGTLASAGGTLTVADNIIDLNYGTTGAPSENAGIKVVRGDESDVSIRWNETDDEWQFTNDGGTYHDMLTATAAKALFSATDAGGDGSFSYSNGVFTYTGPSASEVRAHFSATDAGGDGSFAYDSGTGVFTYTGPSASEVRAHFSAGGDLAYDNSTGVISFTERTDAEVRGLVSATDAGGDGSFAYNSTTGVFTYTGPSASEVRAHFSAGTGVTLSSGQISIGQAVGTSDAVTFGAVTIAGNLIVNGTTTTVNSNTVNIGDNILVLNADETGAPSQDGGIEIERGTSANKTFIWDESEGKWSIGAETFVAGTVEADLTGNVTGTVSSLSNHDTDDVTEGSTNQYFTTARARSSISAGGDLSYNSTTGVVSFTERTDAEVRGLISVTDAGGDGSLAYNNSTGVITYTGPSQAEANTRIDARLSGGTGITYTSGVIATTITQYTDSDARGAISASGDLSYNSGTGVISFTERTDAEVRGLISAGGDLSYNSTTGVMSFTERTDAEVRGLVSADGDLSYNSTTGVFSFTERTDAEVRGLVSVTDSGGDGSLSYNSTTGVITYTGPSASEVRAHFSGGTGISYNSSTGAISLSDTDLISGVTAGTGLSGGGSSGNVTLNVSGLTLSEFNASAITTSAEAFADNDTTLMTSAAIDDRILGYGYTTNVGDITGVTAGAGLTGGGSSGSVTLDVIGGYGITANANDIELANSEVRALFSASGSLSYNSTTGAFSFTEKSDATIRGLFSASGDLSYNSSTGAFSYTMPAITVGDLSASAIQLSSEAFSDSDSVLMTAAAIDDRILGYGYTTNVGDITGVTAGTGLSGGGTAGSVTLNVALSELTDMTAAMVGTDEFIVLDAGADRRKAASEIPLSIFTNDLGNYGGWTTNVGDITSVVAGTNLNGGGTSGDVTVNLDTTLTGMTAATFSGTVTANLFSGTATSAQYADLAEKYSTNETLEAGTVVAFTPSGTAYEIEPCSSYAQVEVLGVISTDPAYMMNSDASGQYVALAGRVPCKVTGPVDRGELLCASGVPGHAQAAGPDPKPGTIIGKAIGFNLEGQAVIEILVNMM